MVWRSRIAQWVVTAIVIVLVGGLFWMALKNAEPAGGPSPASVMGEAMSKAVHQRMLTP